MNGLEHITQVFADAKRTGRTAFMPYFPVGYPDLPTSIDVMEGLAKNGADILEVGVPFSDPLADGATIQRATQVALENGTSVPDALDALRELRKRGVTIPLMLMSYANPLYAYGHEALIQDAVAAGTSGFIIPDLPADEADLFQTSIENAGAGFAHFLAPTSSPARIELAAQKARGFIYLVSVAGITGARDELPPDLQEFVARVRRVAPQPLAVGFGIGTPERAKAIGNLADGVIIGSKVVTLADENPESVFAFARAVRAALD